MSKKAASVELKDMNRVGGFIFLASGLCTHRLTSYIIHLRMNTIVSTLSAQHQTFSFVKG